MDIELINELIEEMEIDGYTHYAEQLKTACESDIEEINTRRSIMDDILSRFKEDKLDITEALNRLVDL